MGSDSKNDVQGRSPSQISPTYKKIVQNLKEIVNKNCTDSEIFAVLKECNMDPNEAVQRLLSQDTFHEVKSKRERRKEMKETQESRARNDGSSNRAVRLGSEHHTAPSVSNSSSYIYRPTGKIINEQPSPHSESFIADNRRQPIGIGDTISSSVKPSPGPQPAWPGVSKGHVSMADIVKRRGSHQNKDSLSEISYTSQHAVSSNSSHNGIKSPKVSSPPEMVHEYGGQHDFNNEWPVIEHPTAASGSSAIDVSAASDAELYSSSDGAKLSRNSQPVEFQVSERGVDNQNLVSNCNTSTRHISVNGAGGVSDDGLLKETNSNDYHGHIHKHQEGTTRNNSASLNDIVLAVSSAVENLQQLNIGKEQPVVPPSDSGSAVVLPNYLQAFAADCSHLSFGTYKSAADSASPLPVASVPLKSDVNVSAAVDDSSAMILNIRNSGYCDDEQLDFMYDTQRAIDDAMNYDSHVSLPELMKQDIPEAKHGLQYMPSATMPNSSIKNIQQPSTKPSFVIEPNARNLPLPSELLSYPEPIPNDLLTSAIQSMRARDPSQFTATQSRNSRYRAAAAVVSPKNSHISMSEVLNSGTFSYPQPQALPASNFAKGTALPQQMSAHSYSQPTLPLGELVNMMGYSSMPQSQTYVPSALQQAYSDSRGYHDSLADMKYNNLPQYRSGVNMTSLRQSNDTTSGYGSFAGSPTSIPGSFLHNLSTSNAGAAVGYDDLLRSQYRDGNNLAPFQQQYQNNSSSTWDYGMGSRTSSTIPDSSYYSLLGQNQQHAGYQQASQHHESLGLGYPNMYHSQTGITRGHQQQSLGDLNLTDYQIPAPKQLNQNWQHRY